MRGETHVNEYGVDVVCAVVPLERRYVRSEVVGCRKRGKQNVGNNRDFDIFQLTWDDEHVPVLVPVVRPVSRGAVADGEPRSLVRYQLQRGEIKEFW